MPRAVTSWTGYREWADTVAECRDEFVRIAKSFWLIPELIPPIVLEDVALLYCFCRRVDDAVDEASDRGQAREALKQWRDELSGRAAPRPLIAAFLAGTARSGHVGLRVERLPRLVAEPFGRAELDQLAARIAGEATR